MKCSGSARTGNGSTGRLPAIEPASRSGTVAQNARPWALVGHIPTRAVMKYWRSPAMSVMPGMTSRSHCFISAGVCSELTRRIAAMRVSWMCSLLLHATAGCAQRNKAATNVTNGHEQELHSFVFIRDIRGSLSLLEDVLVAGFVVDASHERPGVLVADRHDARLAGRREERLHARA